MKNFKIKIVSAVMAAVLALSSCSKDDSSLNSVIRSTATSGVVLRTIAVNSATFNFTSMSSAWTITSEVQDNGNAVSEIRLYTKLNATGVEKLLKTYVPSNFVNGPNGYSRLTISATLSETLTKLGLVSGMYTPADKLIMRLEVLTVDGRLFSNNNASPALSGSYFSSPFVYSAQFACPLANCAIFNGNYKVVVDAWEDYAVGAIIPVSYVPADGSFKFRINNTNNAYINNPSSYYIVTVDPATNAATVVSNTPLLYSPAIAPTNVTGSGSVGSCTGDINLKLTFQGGYNGPNQVFNLVKM